MVTLREARILLKKYADAWVNRDPNAIIKIFEPDAEYWETAFARPFKGHKGIRKYWVEKVAGQEKDIKFRLLNVYVQKDNVIAECYAEFYDMVNDYNVKMKEVALFKVRKGRIYNYREYWSSKHPQSYIKRLNKEDIPLELQIQKVSINGNNYDLIYHKPLKRILDWIQSALIESGKVLPSSMNARIIILPTNDAFVRDHLGGISGYTLDNKTVLLSVYNSKVDKTSIVSTVAHEYCHLAREQYIKWDTITDSIAFEGLAENFETKISGKIPPYAIKLSEKEARKLWEKIKGKLNGKSGLTHNALFFGSETMPLWGGYSLSYYLIRNVLIENKFDFKSLIKMDSKTLVSKALKLW